MPYADRNKRLEYAKKWNHSHYLNNTVKEKTRIYSRRKQISEWFEKYKSTLKCVVCGERETICLDFHHLDGESKDVVVSKMKNWGFGINRIKREIAKCIVLCSNCHRKLHANIISV